MPLQLLQNNAKSTLATAIAASTTASLVLQTGHGARFPQPNAGSGDYFMVTMDDGTNVEVCKCIDRTTDTLTVLRGQEGTTAQTTFAIGTRVECRWTKDSAMKIAKRQFLRVKWVRPAFATTSWHVLGVTLPTVVNSQLAGTLTNSSVRDQNERIRLTHANSAQNPIEWRIAQAAMNGADGYRAVFRFGTFIAPHSSHFFIGLVNTTGAVNSVHPPTSLTQAIGIGWDGAGMGSANLAIYASGAGPATKIDLGSNFNINTMAWIEVEFFTQGNATRIDYTVRRLDISSIADVSSFLSTNIPSNSLYLSPYAHGATMVTSGMAVDHGGLWWES